MNHNELATRVRSAALLVLLVLVLTIAHPMTFNLMLLGMSIILWHEWRGLTRARHWLFAPLGGMYLIAAVAALSYLRQENLIILLTVFAIVWTGDIAAYFVGKRWGKHKIAPAISPGKSWEGLAGSIFASAMVAALLGHVAPLPHAILGALFAVVGLAGDLFESALKRRAGVKDSGRLIPGHGGLFDRVDALLPCAILAALALYLRMHH